MLNDDILKALIEGIIYVAPEPVTIDAIVKVLEGEERERVKAKLEELVAEYELNTHGIQIRQVANGYKFSTKAEHHEVLRKYVKSLKPAVRLSKPALETLAVIAYRQPVTVPEIEEIRGVDFGRGDSHADGKETGGHVGPQERGGPADSLPHLERFPGALRVEGCG